MKRSVLDILDDIGEQTRDTYLFTESEVQEAKEEKLSSDELILMKRALKQIQHEAEMISYWSEQLVGSAEIIDEKLRSES